MTLAEPLVSVIIPVYNRNDLLRRALKSLHEQTYKNFEILVVNDHSTENIKLALDGYTARYMTSNGKGVSSARNTGIQSSSSEFVAFLDSDDEWVPTKLEKQIEYLSINPSISIVHTNEIWIRHGQTVKQNSKQQKMGGRIFSACTSRCLIGPSSVLIRRSLLNRVGLFDENFVVCEDFDLWLRISATEEIGFLSEALTIKHGGHPDQLSMQYHSMDLWRARALVKHLNNPGLTSSEHLELRKSLSQMCQILIKGFEKYKKFENLEEVLKYQALANLPI